MKQNGHNGPLTMPSRRLEIATVMLTGAGKLDTTEEQKDQLVNNALYLAGQLLMKELETRDTKC